MIKRTSEQAEFVLRIDKVTRTYLSGSTTVEALRETSLEIKQGEMVAIMGPSGSGKSTLLSLAGALDSPSSGRVLVKIDDLAKLSAGQLARLRRKTIGYVFQEFNLLPGLTAIENVALPLELDGESQKTSRKSAMEALSRVQIETLANRFPDDMSGGEQQRVAIARAFVGSRDLLLADEPTGALDSATGDIVMGILREQCDQGKSALIVTHNAIHAAWADRVIFIKDGSIIDESCGSKQIVASFSEEPL